MAPAPLAGVAQVFPDARAPDDAIMFGMQRPDPIDNRAFS
jgi:hypothetical protein